MRRAFRFCLPALVLIFFLTASSAMAMPLSEKASINRGMPYYLVVDMTNQYVTAYRTSDNEPIRDMICSTGKYRGSTPKGTFRLLSDVVDPWIDFGSCYIRYGKRITGSIWFHSILYSRRSTDSLIKESFNRLGAPASHGCIRLTPIDAQWISYNCKKGTTVRILWGDKTVASRNLAKRLKSELQAAGHKGIQPILTPTPKPLLLVGSNNSRVKAMHARLRSLGFYTGPIDTLFTEGMTKPAVEAYQTAAGLDPTGQADNDLQIMILKNDSITGRLVTLKYGNNYVAVKAMQRQLRALGYLKASFKLTTSFNATTKAAVIAFQKLAGLPDDGVATPEVQNLMFGAAAPTPSPTPAPVYATTAQLTSLFKKKSTASSARILRIPYNKQVVVLAASDGKWTKIKYGSKSGYALSICLVLNA